jgi:hypothetical protein
MDKVRADKLREVQDGHDGTWVAHPALIPIAKQVRRARSLPACPLTSQLCRTESHMRGGKQCRPFMVGYLLAPWQPRPRPAPPPRARPPGNTTTDGYPHPGPHH